MDFQLGDEKPFDFPFEMPDSWSSKRDIIPHQRTPTSKETTGDMKTHIKLYLKKCFFIKCCCFPTLISLPFQTFLPLIRIHQKALDSVISQLFMKNNQSCSPFAAQEIITWLLQKLEDTMSK